MKKQIAILATIMVASGFAAFGQGYLTFSANTKTVWDEFTTPGSGISSADMDVALLWAPTGSNDVLTTVGSPNPAAGQVATNGVTSVGPANPVASIATMLGAGWEWVTNVYAGSSGFGTLAETLTTTKGQVSYTGGNGGTGLIQVGGSTAGETIQVIAIAWNSSAASFGSATDIGWSNPTSYTTGASTGDPAGGNTLSFDGMDPFGVAAVPEPTTLALAGLGGLSMLFLRRRKA